VATAIPFDDGALERGAIDSWQESPNHGNWCKVGVQPLRHGLSCRRFSATLEEATALSIKVNSTVRSIDVDDTAALVIVPRNELRFTRLNERVSTILCSIALLLSTGLGNATDIDANSFRCIAKMTPVRQFYVDNLQGNLDATLAAANSKTGAVYPPGSLLQLIPTEAMVKQEKGFNAETHDWEFFELDVSKDGTKIRKRGAADVVNRFGGNCFGCHSAAGPQWDLVCETDHGCAPLPVTHAMTRALQRTDPRCDNRPISPEDAEALKQLEQLLKAPG
jgi:hypothetical protein